MPETLELFGDALREIANGPRSTSFQDLTEGLMRRLAEKGVTLEQLCDRKMLNRARSTLEARATKFGIRFPDFVPTNMCEYVEFARHGDFFELSGEAAVTIGKALNITVFERDGKPTVGIPAHSFDSLKSDMRAAGFKAKRAKPSKRKVAANA